MITITSEYLGQLRTRSEHLRSGSIIITDAPTDNQGKGEAFSPTDTLCTALCTCMMTLMGITANREGIELEGLKAEVEKIMASNPRKVSKVRIVFTHGGLKATQEQVDKLIEAARTCPVALSVSKDLVQDVTFNFNRVQP